VREVDGLTREVAAVVGGLRAFRVHLGEAMAGVLEVPQSFAPGPHRFSAGDPRRHGQAAEGEGEKEGAGRQGSEPPLAALHLAPAQVVVADPEEAGD